MASAFCYSNAGFVHIAFLLLFIAATFATSASIRGVSISKLSFYVPGKDFTCLDGSKTIPFANINDDYCDCADGTDEPGTSACRGGHFHCTNAGHRPLNIPSSRVNDMICDCCDGTDEYGGNVRCENTCRELGREERERRQREREAALEGVKIKDEYSNKGKSVIAEKQSQLEVLRATLQTHKEDLESFKTAKESAEEPEKLAKEAHEKQWQEEKAAKEAEKNKLEATEAFAILDINNDGSLKFEELQSHEFLSKDLSGPDLKDYFGDEGNGVTLPQLIDAWSSIGPLYVSRGRSAPPEEETVPHPAIVPPSEGEEAPIESPLELPNAEDIPGVDTPRPIDDDDDDDEGDDTTAGAGSHKSSQDNGDGGMPEYDEETKMLMSAADEARKRFDEAQQKHDDTEREVTAVEKMLGFDFGAHQEFYPLHGHCYDYTDREYVYKLCPFDKSTQESKSGGAATTLGNWDAWSGVPDKYSEMHYKDGQSCWNGPNRSVKVLLSCGIANQVLSVDEPNRCEYVMQFTTPAKCHEDMHKSAHEEL